MFRECRWQHYTTAHLMLAMTILIFRIAQFEREFFVYTKKLKFLLLTVNAFRIRDFIFLILLAFVSLDEATAAKQQSAQLNAEVDAGKIYTTKLGNLPRGADLQITVEVDGEIRVLLLNEGDLVALPDVKRPFFQGKTSDELKFSLKVPERGDYYLMLDNRQGRTQRNFKLNVMASAATPVDLPEETLAKLKAAYKELDEFEAKLRRVFVFDELSFRIGNCGTANTFSDTDTIYICTEIGRQLMQEIGDEAKARDALLFAMLHEVGHVLLNQWDYPFYANEEVADEFATVLMAMFGQAERARIQAEYFSRQSPDEELARKRNRDDRHPLSVQRARNITRWLDDPGLVKRWQKVLVPHMQSSALRALESRPKPWVDSVLIKEELARRGVE